MHLCTWYRVTPLLPCPAFWEPHPHPTAVSRVTQASETQGQIRHLPLLGLILNSSPARALPQQAAILPMEPVSGPPPMECPPPFVPGLSICCPGKVFHLHPEPCPSHPYCPDSVPSRVGPDSHENHGPMALVGEHLSSSVTSIGWNMKACFQREYQWLVFIFFFFFPPSCCFQSKCFSRDNKTVCSFLNTPGDLKRSLALRIPENNPNHNIQPGEWAWVFPFDQYTYRYCSWVWIPLSLPAFLFEQGHVFFCCCLVLIMFLFCFAHCFLLWGRASNAEDFAWGV